MGNANSINVENESDSLSTGETNKEKVLKARDRAKKKLKHAEKILRESTPGSSESSRAEEKDPSSSLWGNVFIQGEGAEKWSYHFVSEDGEGEEGAFLSQQNTDVKLDDGSAFPDRVPFVEHSFDEETRVFRGTIHYSQTCESTAWGGYETEEVEMKFDTEFTVILTGKVVWKDKDGEELAQNFGMCHIYVNAHLTDRITHSGQYKDMVQRLKQEGATTRTVTTVARVFLELSPQANHSARHQAILDIVREHTPNPTPSYNPGAPWGNTFVRKSGVSLHILANSAYISYEQRQCGTRKLDDRSPAPSRVPFVSHSYDEEQRTFRGSIDFVASYQSTWGGVVKCDYEMRFDTEFMVILEGTVVKEFEEGKKETLNFTEKDVHYYNEAIAFKVMDAKQYLALLDRLRDEGATDETVSAIQDVFREDARANLFVRHQAVLDIVSRDWVELRYLDHVWKNDREICLAALAQNGHALYYASDNLKTDHDFILSAVKTSGSALIYTSPTLKDHPDVVLAAVSNDGTSLKYVSAALQDNQQIVTAAVSSNGQALEYASKALKDDAHIVTKAVSNCGAALEHASENLRDDKEIVAAAIQNDVAAFMFASDNCKNDEDVVTAAVSQDGSTLQYASKHFRTRKDIVLLAVKSRPISLKYALGGLTQDRDCLVSAGLLSFKDFSQDNTTKRIVLSCPLDQDGKSTPHAILFSLLLRDHTYFNDFIVHFPNSFDQNTTDPQTTDFGWQLQRGKDTRGIMIQIREYDHSPSVRDHVLGDAQRTETEMATEVGIKVFQIYQGKTHNKRWAKDFEEKHIDILVQRVKDWYHGDCADMNEIEIKL